jgi:hypothetical protein
MTETPQHRRRRIRRNVAGASLAIFALAWGVIAGTGSTGASTPAATSTTSAAPSVQSSQQQSQQSQPDLTTRQS